MLIVDLKTDDDKQVAAAFRLIVAHLPSMAGVFSQGQETCKCGRPTPVKVEFEIPDQLWITLEGHDGEFRYRIPLG